MNTRLIVGALVLIGCEHRSVRVAPDPAPDVRATPTETVLPLVSGCGCAYQCARGVRAAADGVWEVTHDLLDSTTITAVIETRCFDDSGLARAGDCRRVFYDRSPCGGECIPTTAHLRCGEK